MGRETAEKRDEAFGRVERACAKGNVLTWRDGPRLHVRLSPERVLVCSGGGGVGTLKVQAVVDDVVDAEATLTPDGVISRALAAAVPS